MCVGHFRRRTDGRIDCRKECRKGEGREGMEGGRGKEGRYKGSTERKKEEGDYVHMGECGKH